MEARRTAEERRPVIWENHVGAEALVTIDGLLVTETACDTPCHSSPVSRRGWSTHNAGELAHSEFARRKEFHPAGRDLSIDYYVKTI